jgi:hypothetical protein
MNLERFHAFTVILNIVMCLCHYARKQSTECQQYLTGDAYWTIVAEEEENGREKNARVEVRHIYI